MCLQKTPQIQNTANVNTEKTLQTQKACTTGESPDWMVERGELGAADLDSRLGHLAAASPLPG